MQYQHSLKKLAYKPLFLALDSRTIKHFHGNSCSRRRHGRSPGLFIHPSLEDWSKSSFSDDTTCSEVFGGCFELIKGEQLWSRRENFALAPFRLGRRATWWLKRQSSLLTHAGLCTFSLKEVIYMCNMILKMHSFSYMYFNDVLET